MNYFDVDGYVSNSGLGELKRALNGDPSAIMVKAETLQDGRDLHTCALEPNKYKAEEIKKNPILKKMVDSLERNLLYSFMRHAPGVKIEHEKYFTCKFTGAKIKIKPDIMLLPALGDIKGTAATTLASFVESIVKFDYPRQAALYMDGTGANKFTFFGVMKKHPYTTFTVTYHKSDAKIMEAREEYIYLIRKAIEMKMIKTKFANL